MSNSGGTLYNTLFASLISEIKSYDGDDPLRPWLRGIQKMKDTLPPQLLKEKLPRFLQKCTETFLTDRRYSNDLRYLRVWLQLMDCVENPKAVLRTMEMNCIGIKKALFYQAFALYYEKRKKFEEADKIYHLGVQNLAEPVIEMQKSYDQFLHLMERYKNKRMQYQARKTKITLLASGSVLQHQDEVKVNGDGRSKTEVKVYADGRSKTSTDDTLVVKFLDTAIVAKSNAEDVRHHGLVEPTINTKEAMDTINSMFREPLEPSSADRRKYKGDQPKNCNSSKNELKIFTDESFEDNQQPQISGVNQPSCESFNIYVDGEESSEAERIVHRKDIQTQTGKVFGNSNILPSEGHKHLNTRRAYQSGLREDTDVYKFIGSTISNEPKMENVLHHGLVDPTINFKEAMKDINGMFGKPIEYARKSRSKKQDNVVDENKCEDFLIYHDDEPDSQTVKVDMRCSFQVPKSIPGKGDGENHTGFLILPDDDGEDFDAHQETSLPAPSSEKGSDLFEQTLCTKEAMDEINKLFTMPMDF